MVQLPAQGQHAEWRLGNGLAADGDAPAGESGGAAWRSRLLAVVAEPQKVSGAATLLRVLLSITVDVMLEKGSL